METNLVKSDAGWLRFRARTNGGANARRARMESRPRIVKKQREQRLSQTSKPQAVAEV